MTILNSIILGLTLFASAANAELWQRAEYAGSFRVPLTRTGQASRFGYAGETMAFGADKSTLWMEGHAHHQMVAELSIPELVRSQAPRDLPLAEVVTPFSDITLGKKVGQLGGLAFDEGRFWWTSEQHYDVSPTVYPSLGFTVVTGESTAYGPWQADVGNKLTERYITLAPLGFANEHLGGRYLICGQGGVSGNTDASFGPCAVAVTPPGEDTPLDQLIETRTMLFYPRTDGRALFRAADTVTALAWISDGPEPSQNWLVFACRIGTGVLWYGPGDEPPEGGIVDRWKGAKGYHAPPYEERLYIYRLDDVLRTLAGDVSYWEVEPREVVDLRPVLLNPGFAWVALAYDESRGRLYISENKGDGTQSRYEAVPVVHAFDFRPEIEPEPDDDVVAELRVRVAELEAKVKAMRARIAAAREALE